MPSPDTFNRVFQIIDPMGFKSECKAFVRAVYKGIMGKDIAIDGKTPRGVKWVGSSSPAHIVSAYCPAHQFVVDYLKSEEKGGELALMLALLELLTLEERTVAIDTAGTHTDVVEKIQSQGGHFVLTVKGYQKNLLRLSGIGSVRTGGVRYRPMRRWAREVYRKSVGSTRTEGPTTSPICPTRSGSMGRSAGTGGGENNLHWALDVLLHERASFKSIVFIFLLPLMGKKSNKLGMDDLLFLLRFGFPVGRFLVFIRLRYLFASLPPVGYLCAQK